MVSVIAVLGFGIGFIIGFIIFVVGMFYFILIRPLKDPAYRAQWAKDCHTLFGWIKYLFFWVKHLKRAWIAADSALQRLTSKVD